MFRIADNKINIYGMWVETMEGSHTISVTEEGEIVTDGNGTVVCSYNLDKTGHIVINQGSGIGESIGGGNRPIEALDWRWNSIISRGVLFEEPLGVGPEITVYLEGFAFSFNYYSVAHIVSALKPFVWTGGRVCYKSMFTPAGGGATTHQYTAIPAAMSCGTAGWDHFSTFSSVTPPSMGGFTFLNAAARDAIEFYGNSTSITFSYRTHRKYLFFASNVYGLFSSGIGNIAGGDGGFPSGGNIPDPGNTSFSFSMFSLSN